MCMIKGYFYSSVRCFMSQQLNYLSLESDCRYNQSTSHLAPNFSIQVAMGSIKIIYRRISKKQQEKENDKNDYPSLPPLILIC